MKKLYVTDLDGTLLHSDETLSDYTIQIINDLVNQGMLFSYATARSFHTAKKVTQGLNVDIPLIVYNGVSIRDNITGNIILSNTFEHVDDVLDDLISHGIMPIVYSYIDGVEKFSYVEDKVNASTMDFIKTRAGDPRNHPIDDIQQLYLGDIFYITCIDETTKLEPMYQKYYQQYHCIYSKDIYSSSLWLEITPQNTSKAHAIQQLKEYLHCNYIVAFGDGKNDIEMFEIADESYAVENADEELKNIATGIIFSNNEDGVARWLKKEFNQ
ncbi:MAG: HAD family hydrolase [Erysipelotrichaceae bacterium]|nr:HAD family hydrolase [Erysipelotrichaceae bacterium]